MKLPKLFLISLGFTLFATLNTQAQITIEEIAIGNAIENREIIGIDSVFSNSINTLYCYTKITGAENEPVIQHVWYFEEEEMSKVNLTIRTPSFRTWSSKKIWYTWVGNWRVEVMDASGKLLAVKKFKITD